MVTCKKENFREKEKKSENEIVKVTQVRMSMAMSLSIAIGRANATAVVGGSFNLICKENSIYYSLLIDMFGLLVRQKCRWKGNCFERWVKTLK